MRPIIHFVEILFLARARSKIGPLDPPPRGGVGGSRPFLEVMTQHRNLVGLAHGFTLLVRENLLLARARSKVRPPDPQGPPIWGGRGGEEKNDLTKTAS